MSDDVEFNGTGLGSDTFWGVELWINGTEFNGSALATNYSIGNSTIGFDEAAGSYVYEVISFGYATSPGHGEFNLANQLIQFSVDFSVELTFSASLAAYVNFGSTTTLDFVPSVSTNVSDYNYTGVVQVLSELPNGSLTYGCGSGNITGASYAFTCSGVINFDWLSIMGACTPTSGGCFASGWSPYCWNIGSYGNPAFYQHSVFGYWGPATTVANVTVSNSTPNVSLDFNATVLSGPNSTGIACPCVLNISGIEYANFSSYGLSLVNTTYLNLSLPAGQYVYDFKAMNGNPFCTWFTVCPLGQSEVLGDFLVAKAPQIYPIDFIEDGLPDGTPWSITVDRTTYTTTTDHLTINLEDGDHPAALTSPDPSVLPQSGTIPVDGLGYALPLEFSNITFNQTSQSQLDESVAWSVESASGELTATSGIEGVQFYALNGTYQFDVVPIPGYGANLTGDGVQLVKIGEANVTVAGFDVDVGVTFEAFEYGVAFTEVGIPFRTVGVFAEMSVDWSVELQDGSGPPQVLRSNLTELLFARTNGTFGFTVTAPAGWTIATPVGSNVDVSGASVSVSVHFVAIYPVTLTESGLSGNTTWNMSVQGNVSGQNVTTPGPHSTGTISFALKNGTWYLSAGATSGYVPEASEVMIVVAGHSVGLAIRFALKNQTVALVFTQTGLPIHNPWSVTVAGLTAVGNGGGPIAFAEPNGTYAYSVPSNGQWVPTPGRGTVPVSGAAVTVAVVFYYTFPLTITEPAGVASGSSWQTMLTGSNVIAMVAPATVSVSENTTGASLVFDEPNGTYSYVVTVAGEPSYMDTGTVTIQGAGTTVTPSAVTHMGGSSGSESWLEDLTSHFVYVLVGIVVILGILVALFSSRRRST